jgi:hypothetical protein
MKFKYLIFNIKMSEICEYCNGLSSKSNLLYHQKSNKKCIEIQKTKFGQVNCILKDCEFCKKKFNINSLKKHLLICKVKLSIETELKKEEEKKIHLEKEREYENRISKIEKQFQNRISELEKINLYQENKITELTEHNIKLQTENDMYKNIYEKDHQIITSMAQQPKTTTNTNNNIINLAVYDNKLITDRFTDVLSSIKSTDLYDGQESISRFIAPCLKNDDGTQLYKCTDYSRGVYVKKDKDGNMVKDINGKKLVELIEPIASKKAEELLEEDNNKREKQRKLKYLKNHIENQYNELENLKQHMKGYNKNSNDWKHHNERLKTVVNDIDKCIQEQQVLENEGVYILDEDELWNEKLTDGVNDIKNMKKDHTKFSKKLSKLLN